jgi:hypothetical protein
MEVAVEVEVEAPTLVVKVENPNKTKDSLLKSAES